MTFLADCLMWAWCWLAYRLVLVLPIAPRRSAVDRFTLWLLPFAGYYGFHEPYLPWRWSPRVRR